MLRALAIWIRPAFAVVALVALAGCGGGHTGAPFVSSADASSSLTNTTSTPSNATSTSASPANTTSTSSSASILTALPEPPGGMRARARVTALPGGAALVTGGLGPNGNSPVALSQVLFFDPVRGRFFELAPLAHARCGHEATLLPAQPGVGPEVLVTGGCDGQRVLDSVELIRLVLPTAPEGLVSSETIPLPALPSPRADHCAVLVATGANAFGVLLTGGVSELLAATAIAVLYRVDSGDQGVISGRSVMIAQPRFARSEHTAIVLNGPDGVFGTDDDRVLIYGGVGGDSTVASDGSLVSVLAAAEVYEPWTDRWTTVRAKGAIPASSGRPRHGHRCAHTADGGALMLGGMDSKEGILETLAIQLDAADAGLATFSDGASLAHARRDAEVAELDTGRIMLAGGYDTATGQILSDAELFSADGRTREPSASLGGPRAQHALATLGARVLLVGGINDVQSYANPTAGLLNFSR